MGCGMHERSGIHEIYKRCTYNGCTRGQHVGLRSGLHLTRLEISAVLCGVSGAATTSRVWE